MRPLHYIIYGFTLFYSITLNCQQLNGVVVDSGNKNPLQGVNLYSGNSNIGTYSTEQGKYSINLKRTASKADTITISFIGYRTQEIILGDLQKKDTVFLDALSEVLDIVNIESKIKLKPTVPFRRLRSMKQELHSFASLIIGDHIYLFGGDMSYNTNGFLRILDTDPSIGDFNLTGDPQGFNKFLTQARMNSWDYQGYNDRIYAYNISEDNWSTLKYKTIPRAYLSAFYDDKYDLVYLLGGKTISRNGQSQYLDHRIEAIDLNNGQIIISNNPHSSVNSAVIPIDGGALVIGGSTKLDKNDRKEFMNDLHLFNSETKKWFKIGETKIAKETAAALANNNLFLFGGGFDQSVSTIESLNLDTGKWKYEGDLFQPLNEIAIAASKRTIYLYHPGKLLAFDIISKTLKEFQINIFNRNPSMLFNNYKLYLIGGYKYETNSMKPLSSFFSIDIRDLERTQINKIKAIN